MKFDHNFFLWFRFIVGALKLLVQVFGDNEATEDLKKNGF